jgi:hypothetical protein
MAEACLGETCLDDDLIVITSHSDDAPAVARDLARGLRGRKLAGALVFCSHRFARQPLAAAIAQVTGDVPLVGCTSAGELSERGYDADCVVFVGFPAHSFRMAAHCFDDLDHFDPARGGRAVRALLGGLYAEAPAGFAHHAALFLVDGLSRREELLAMTVQEALGQTLLVGGSSGDGMLFRETGILVDGRFRTDAAVVVLLASCRPLHAFSAHHYLPGAERMVVTAADPERRTVFQINARPAAAEYARVAGRVMAGEPLDAAFFAAHPPMVRAGGGHYVRAIRAVNPDGSLTFYGAIDSGVVLTVGQPRDRLAQLETLFDQIEQDLGGIDHVIGFDCVLNRIDAESRQLTGAVSQLYSRRGVIGFNTYGEQFHAAHINQTLSGLAIGR